MLRPLFNILLQPLFHSFATPKPHRSLLMLKKSVMLRAFNALRFIFCPSTTFGHATPIVQYFTATPVPLLLHAQAPPLPADAEKVGNASRIQRSLIHFLPKSTTFGHATPIVQYFTATPVPLLRHAQAPLLPADAEKVGNASRIQRSLVHFLPKYDVWTCYAHCSIFYCNPCSTASPRPSPTAPC
jgi:hypothetical protein